MANPLRRLKFLPWLLLFQVAALTTVTVVVLEFLMRLGYTKSLAINRALYLLFTPPLGILVNVAIAVGVGVLAVTLLENLYKQVVINAAVLWALVFCLALGLVLKALLPIPDILLNLNEIQLVSMAVGVFWKGRPYWR